MQTRHLAPIAITAPLWVACATPQFLNERGMLVRVHRRTGNLLDKCLRLENMSVRVQGSMVWV
jgi:hypothetical protein